MRRPGVLLLLMVVAFMGCLATENYVIPQIQYWTYVRAQPDAGANIDLLARLICAEAQGEQYEGQVGVGAVVLNRTKSASFPGTIAGVIYQPWAFESVEVGLIWQRTPTWSERRAAIDAVSGWDPTYGCTFFWNPSKPVSPWIWSRSIVRQIGNHVFAL
jgi:N-acetylmuramoyl-L-alanine amidase